MPHLPNPSGFPGIAGLMAYRAQTGDALRGFAQALLRGPSSLTPGERELIATYVSSRNGCAFCTRSHAAVARRLGDASQVADVLVGSLENLSPKLRILLAIAEHVRTRVAPVPHALVTDARKLGVDDVALHDAVLVAAAFCMFNRYVDGLDVDTPGEGPAYEKMADRLAGDGYLKSPA